MNFRDGGDGSQFFRVREARSDEYRMSSSDKRQRNPEKLAPSLWVAAKIGAYFVVGLGSGPATTCALRLVCFDFLAQRHHP